MKKILSCYKYKSFFGCRFYLDDLERILDLFKERDYLVEIADKENIYEDLDELKETRGLELSRFNIKGSCKDKCFEYVNIRFERDHTKITLNCPDKNDSLIVIFEKIKEICESCHIKYFRRLILSLFIIFWFIILVSLKTNNAVFLLGAGFIVLTSVCYHYISFRKSVILRMKHEGGFWKRNKDTIIDSIIVAAAGAFITYLLMRK